MAAVATGALLFIVAAFALSLGGIGGTGGPATSPRPSTLPTSGINEQLAVQLAQQYAPLNATAISAKAGAFGDVSPETSFLPDQTTLARAVWAVTFKVDFDVCPPPVPERTPTCQSQPGTTTVILDFNSGDFVASYGYAPAP
jgi:hypothetical protein